MSNPILAALEQAAQRIGHSLSKEAGKAIEDLYRDAGHRAEQVVKNLEEAETSHIRHVTQLAERLGSKQAEIAAEKNVEKRAALEAENATLKKRFEDAFEPKPPSGEAAPKPPGSWKGKPPSELLGPHVPGPSRGTQLLGKLPEDKLKRDETTRLITHIDGKPYDEYLEQLANERRDAYVHAKSLGPKDPGFISRGDTGNAMGVGLDRRTGGLYEGVNGRETDKIDRKDLHPVLADNLKELEKGGPYTNRAGEGQPYPHADDPLGHAEVKAANAMLHDRAAAGHPTGHEALDEFSFCPQFPFIKNTTEAPMCPNCTAMLPHVHPTYGVRHSEEPRIHR